MLPDEFDVLSWREILLVIRADGDVSREAWRQVATISTFIYNYSREHKRGFTLKKPRHFFPNLYRKIMSNFNKRYQAALDQEAEYLAQVEKKAQRLAREAEENVK